MLSKSLYVALTLPLFSNGLVLLQQNAEIKNRVLRSHSEVVSGGFVGTTVPISEKGYQLVASLKNDDEMKVFIQRVLEKECRYAKDVSELNGLVPFYSGVESVQNLEGLKKELRGASWVSEGEGRTASLNNEGYQKVARLKSKAHMTAYARRILDVAHKKCSDEGALAGMIPYFNGELSVQTFGQLQQELLSAPWAVARDAEQTKPVVQVALSEQGTSIVTRRQDRFFAALGSRIEQKSMLHGDPIVWMVGDEPYLVSPDRSNPIKGPDAVSKNWDLTAKDPSTVAAAAVKGGVNLMMWVSDYDAVESLLTKGRLPKGSQVRGWMKGVEQTENSFRNSNPTDVAQLGMSVLWLHGGSMGILDGMQSMLQSGTAHTAKTILQGSILNSVAEEIRNTGHGKTECPCVGIDGNRGAVNITIEEQMVSYPGDFGTRCEAWDDDRHPTACISGGDKEKEGFCAQKWCYVDACSCDSGLPMKSAYAKHRSYKGKPLYYSYATCGGEDTFSAWHGAKKGKNKQQQQQQGEAKEWNKKQQGEAKEWNKQQQQQQQQQHQQGEAKEWKKNKQQQQAKEWKKKQQQQQQQQQQVEGNEWKKQQVEAKEWKKDESKKWKNKVVSKVENSIAVEEEDDPDEAEVETTTTVPTTVLTTTTVTTTTVTTTTVTTTTVTTTTVTTTTVTTTIVTTTTVSTTAAPEEEAEEALAEAKDEPKDEPKKSGWSWPWRRHDDNNNKNNKNHNHNKHAKKNFKGEKPTRDVPKKSESRGLEEEGDKKEWKPGQGKDKSKHNEWKPKKNEWHPEQQDQHKDQWKNGKKDQKEHSPNESESAVKIENPVAIDADAADEVDVTSDAEHGDAQVEVEMPAEELNAELEAMCSAPVDAKVSGESGCMCVGFADSHGLVEVEIGNDTVKYPVDVGGSCSAWDKDTHPECVVDEADDGNKSVPDWCHESWCYVDPCSCNVEAVLSAKGSGYMPKSNFEGRPLYYSYKACGSVDLWTSGEVEACANKEESDCVGDCSWTGSKCTDQQLVSVCDAEAEQSGVSRTFVHVVVGAIAVLIASAQ